MPQPLYSWGKTPAIHCIGDWVGPQTGLDSMPLLGLKSQPLSHPAHSRSLYWLCYSGSMVMVGQRKRLIQELNPFVSPVYSPFPDCMTSNYMYNFILEYMEQEWLKVQHTTEIFLLFSIHLKKQYKKSVSRHSSGRTYNSHSYLQQEHTNTNKVTTVI
jgi:hypothetical protein